MFVRARVGTNSFVEQASASVTVLPLQFVLGVVTPRGLADRKVFVIGLTSPVGREVTGFTLTASPSVSGMQCDENACEFEATTSTTLSASAYINGRLKTASASAEVVAQCTEASQRQARRGVALEECLPPCDPSVDPTCLQPLTGADSSLLVSVTQYLRPYAQIASPGDQAACAAMFSAFTIAFQQGRVFRGKDDSPVDGEVSLHYAATFGDTVHIDPALLNAANYPLPASRAVRRKLLNVMLHEGAHLAKYTDHNRTTGYAQFPYSLANPTGPNGISICVQ